MKRIVLALIAAVAVVASANFASARVATPEMLVTGNNVERVLFGGKKYKAPKFKQTKFKAPKFKYTKFKAPKFKYSKFKHKKFGHHKVKKPKGPSYGPKGHSATGLYVVGGVVAPRRSRSSMPRSMARCRLRKKHSGTWPAASSRRSASTSSFRASRTPDRTS